MLKYCATPGLSLEAGAETAANPLESHTAFSQNGAAVALPAANVEVEEDRSEVFAETVWRPTPEWTVERGFRHARQDFGGPRGINPLQATDDRDFQVGRSVQLRIRKTLG